MIWYKRIYKQYNAHTIEQAKMDFKVQIII
jgi:hypothetical protein